ncbi:aspartate--tRNA ligase [Mycoplasmoides genitalium]
MNLENEKCFNQRILIGSISTEQLNKTIVIIGWIKRIKKLGEINFILVGDKSGTIQVTCKDKEQIQQLTREDIVIVKAKLQRLDSVRFELINPTIKLFSKSKTPPLIIEDETDALEEVRLKYRYLDLRRRVMQKRLLFRHQFILAIRNWFNQQGFIEIETPTLSKSTPEGAQDFLVPARIRKDCFYALVQSPQIYKQLLMIAGVEKYFQIARVYRDEDSRKDRQPEHTQIDFEISFCNQKMIMNLVEKLFFSVFLDVFQIKIKKTFPVFKFSELFERFGSDKPDLRYGFEIKDFTSLLQDHQNQFTKLIEAKGIIGGIELTNIELSTDKIKALRKIAKDHDVSLEVHNKNNSTLKTSIKYDEKNTLLLVANKSKKKAWTALGAIRNELKYHLDIVKPNQYSFCWVVDFPLYDFDEKTNQWISNHNIFSKPKQEWIDNFESNKNEALSEQFDLVLNGFEIGSGSIRINDPIVQKRLMNSLNIDPNKFAFLLEAYQYGAPVHGGMGLGIDRLMMILNQTDNIREVIAFPKNNHGIEVHTNAPDKIEKEEVKWWIKELVK